MTLLIFFLVIFFYDLVLKIAIDYRHYHIVAAKISYCFTKVKKSNSYGLAIGKMIGDEWFVGKSGSDALYTMRKKWIAIMLFLS